MAGHHPRSGGMSWLEIIVVVGAIILFVIIMILGSMWENFFDGLVQASR